MNFILFIKCISLVMAASIEVEEEWKLENPNLVPVLLAHLESKEKAASIEVEESPKVLEGSSMTAAAVLGTVANAIGGYNGGYPAMDQHHNGHPVMDQHHNGYPVMDQHHNGYPVMDQHRNGYPVMDQHRMGYPNPAQSYYYPNQQRPMMFWPSPANNQYPQNAFQPNGGQWGRQGNNSSNAARQSQSAGGNYAHNKSWNQGTDQVNSNHWNNSNGAQQNNNNMEHGGYFPRRLFGFHGFQGGYNMPMSSGSFMSGHQGGNNSHGARQSHGSGGNYSHNKSWNQGTDQVNSNNWNQSDGQHYGANNYNNGYNRGNYGSTGGRMMGYPMNSMMGGAYPYRRLRGQDDQDDE